MKASPNKSIFTVSLIAAGLLCARFEAAGSPSKSATRTASKAAAANSKSTVVNSYSTNFEAEIPASTFSIPTSPRDGRDPFFPDSTRVYTADAPKAKPNKSPISLKLNGLSGPVEKRLAIINGRTVAEGEEAEIPTSTGRQQVRCISIDDDSVVVEVGGERRELKLREGL